jgi:hypothetical protein
MAEAGQGDARSDAEGAAAPSGAPATFFKRRVARGKLAEQGNAELRQADLYALPLGDGESDLAELDGRPPYLELGAL